jgi:uncharacterized membrane protein
MCHSSALKKGDSFILSLFFARELLRPRTETLIALEPLVFLGRLEALADIVFIVLLIVHILAVVAWMGAAFLFGSVLAPSLSKMEGNARAEFLSKLIPRYTRYVFASSIVAVIFGLALYGYTSAYSRINFPSGSGLTFLQAGAGLGLIALIITLGFVMPAARKLFLLLKSSAQGGGGGGVDITSTQKRVRMGTGIVAGLLLIVLVLMVVGATL